MMSGIGTPDAFASLQPSPVRWTTAAFTGSFFFCPPRVARPLPQCAPRNIAIPAMARYRRKDDLTVGQTDRAARKLRLLRKTHTRSRVRTRAADAARNLRLPLRRLVRRSPGLLISARAN